MLLNLFLLVFGIFLLFLGGSVLVKSTIFLSQKLKRSLFLVSFLLLGVVSSAPELIVTLQSHFKSEADIALGNIIGSNIFNILVVGSLILITQVKIQNKNIIIKNVSFLLTATLIVAYLSFDESLSRLNGLFLLILFGVVLSKPFLPHYKEPLTENSFQSHIYFFLIPLGFGCLFLGSHITIESSIFIAESFDISRRIIGLFLVSIGTSLPELTIGIIALLKKTSEVALGSIVGSNIFNTLFIPGIAALFLTFPVSSTILQIDGLVMWMSELVLLLYLFFEKTIPRNLASAFFLSFYICYCVFVFQTL